MTKGRLNFPLAEYHRRYEQVVKTMKAQGLDALFTRNMDHICYLTGYEDPHVIMYHGLLVLPDAPFMFIRRYELTNLEEFSWVTEWQAIEDYEHPSAVVARKIKELGLGKGRIGIEQGLRKAGMFCSAEEVAVLRRELPDVELANALDVIPSVRVVKSDLEIDAMRTAAGIAEQGIKDALQYVRAGMTENDVAAEYFRSSIKNGGEYTSLAPFMVSGRRTALPHGTWRRRELQQGDPFLFEVSANYKRYEVPAMLTVNIGEPTPLVKAVAAASIEALEAAIDMIRPGVVAQDVHARVYDIMDKHGFAGEHYKHPSGYSIGVSLPPAWSETHYITFNTGVDKVLEPNMTFHVVPIALIGREVGVGFSASVRVAEDGCEPLTTHPREFMIV